MDIDSLQIRPLEDELSLDFIVKFDTGLNLLTVRHYKNEEVDQLINDKEVFLIQRNTKTIQILYCLEHLKILI